MRTRSTPRRALVALITLTVVAAACGGGGDDAADTTTTSAAATSTSTSTSSSSTSVPASTTTVERSTTTTIPDPTYPLTGLPQTDVLLSMRRALVVKIDNHPAARPQTGLNQADIVYEENVEQLTRFAAVMHSQASEIAGPVRSGRTQDISLLSSLNHPLLAWSGGNGAVTAAINASELVNMSALVAPGYFRSTDKSSPHNLYVNTTTLWEAAPQDLSPPPAQFDYVDQGQQGIRGGRDSAGVKVGMDGVDVQWTWDPTTGTYVRVQDGNPHVDSNGEQVRAKNVVILFVEYRPSPADANSPEAQTTGTGDVWIYSDGKLRIGKWSRTDLKQPWTFTQKGNPLELLPGNTWVELARDFKAADIPAGTDPATIPYP